MRNLSVKGKMCCSIDKKRELFSKGHIFGYAPLSANCPTELHELGFERIFLLKTVENSVEMWITDKFWHIFSKIDNLENSMFLALIPRFWQHTLDKRVVHLH